MTIIATRHKQGRIILNWQPSPDGHKIKKMPLFLGYLENYPYLCRAQEKNVHFQNGKYFKKEPWQYLYADWHRQDDA
jgi:hypothetical protein